MLNSELEFMDLPTQAQAAFIGRRATKNEFTVGARFYKFTGNRLFGSGRRVSPWWSGVAPLESGDPGLAETLRRAQRLGVVAKDFARARSAVTREWNSLENLIVVRLLRPVCGFVGRCASQPYSERPSQGNVVWIGGAWQAYIPNLTEVHVARCRGG